MGGPQGGQAWGSEKERQPHCILGEAFSRGFLWRLVPPELVGDLDPLTNVTAALHSPLTLLCEATGIPPPTVRWFRGEEPVSPGEDTYLLAGKGPARGVSDCQVWPSASVHRMPVTSDPELPGLVGVTVSAAGFQECTPKDWSGKNGFK